MGKLISILTIAGFLFFSSCGSGQPSKSAIIDLSQRWLVQSSAKIKAKGREISRVQFNPVDWYPVSLPATVLAALVENGVYPDPFYSLNLKSISGYREGRWLAMQKSSPFYPTWWYRREFEIPADFADRRLIFHLDGINYKASVWLNGQQIADSSEIVGMFRRFEFDVSLGAKIGGKNVLAVEISAPGKLPDVPYKTKQLEATTGWDDHNPQPPDLNMGIWRKVYLSSCGPVRLKFPYVNSDLKVPELTSAQLTVSVDAENLTNQEISGKIVGLIGTVKFERTLQLQPHETHTVKTKLIFTNPRVWWPHPLGPQSLYHLKLQFVTQNRVSDQVETSFGIRKAETYLNSEGWRGYKINGKKILIRGGAWMTSDMLLRLTPRRYEALIRYAREANLNMLRSEGFSVRETDEFYDLCDKYGVMVTQQIFGRNLPDEMLAIENVKDMLLRIRNHPSLVHFLGHDETFPTPALDKAYRDMIARYTPERSYQPHSGAFKIEDRFKTGGTRTGTLELWTYANPAHYYTHKADGAWGFAQSGGIGGIFAPLESMRRMMPEKNIWHPFNETFSFHTVLQGVNYFREVFDAMEARYGKIRNMEDFGRKGMALNYESARGMFEAYGRNKFDALGITTWKYDAAWPAALTWQYVDWYLNVGGAYYGAKKACEPLHVQYAYDDSAVYVINNYYQPFENLTVTAKLFSFDLKEKLNRTVKLSVEANGKRRAFKVQLPSRLSTTYFLKLSLTNESGLEISDNFYWLSTKPDIEGKKGVRGLAGGWHGFTAEPLSSADFTALQQLPPVKLDGTMSIDKKGEEQMAVVVVKNSTNHLAFMVHPALTNPDDGKEIAPVYWSVNYFSLLPGESKKITARFSGSGLKGLPPVLKVDGWNIQQK